MFALGSKVVSKSHGIPGVVEEVQKVWRLSVPYCQGFWHALG